LEHDRLFNVDLFLNYNPVAIGGRRTIFVEQRLLDDDVDVVVNDIVRRFIEVA